MARRRRRTRASECDSARAGVMRDASASPQSASRASSRDAMERYEKGRTLGEGTFGVVHEARVREVRRERCDGTIRASNG